MPPQNPGVAAQEGLAPPDGADDLREDEPEGRGPPALLAPGAGAGEEWAAGLRHWVAILAVVAALWWFWSRKSGSPGGHRPSSGGHRAASRLDADALRQKRLEALGTGPPQDAAEADGLRQRGAAAAAADGPTALAAARQAPGAALGAAPAAAAGRVAGAAAAAPSTAAAASFAVQVRGILRGTSTIHAVGGLTAHTTLQELRERVVQQFGASASRVRLYAGGKELTKPEAQLQNLGITAGSALQVMFITQPAGRLAAPPAAAAAPTAAAAAAAAGGRLRADASPAAVAASAGGSPPALTPAPAPAAAAAPVAGAPVAVAAPVATAAPAGGRLRTWACPTCTCENAADAAACQACESSRPIAASGGEPLSLRAQGSLRGVTSSHIIQDVTTETTVLQLEEHIAAAFDVKEEFRMRLFFMGRELKDLDSRLGRLGLTPGATVQALFAPGKAAGPGPSGPGTVPPPVSPAAAADLAAAVSALGGGQPGDGAAATEAMMSACAAAGCNPGALFSGGVPLGAAAPDAAAPGAAAAGGVSAPAASAAATAAAPEEAWRAMVALEAQLARATDNSEPASVRDAASMLRVMLQTTTHGSNPALLAFAQAAVPDISKIWGFEPTRERLLGILALPACALPEPGGDPDSAAGSSGSGVGGADGGDSGPAGAGPA